MGSPRQNKSKKNKPSGNPKLDSEDRSPISFRLANKTIKQIDDLARERGLNRSSLLIGIVCKEFGALEQGSATPPELSYINDKKEKKALIAATKRLAHSLQYVADGLYKLNAERDYGEKVDRKLRELATLEADVIDLITRFRRMVILHPRSVNEEVVELAVKAVEEGSTDPVYRTVFNTLYRSSPGPLS